MKLLYGCKTFTRRIRLCFEKTFMIIMFACEKTPFIKEKSSLRNLPSWTEYLFLRKIFLMNEKSWLMGENFLDPGKILACWKLPWWTEYLCLRKTSLIKEKHWLVEKTRLMKEKCLLVENVLDEGKIFAFGKRPWWRKTLGLW